MEKKSRSAQVDMSPRNEMEISLFGNVLVIWLMVMGGAWGAEKSEGVVVRRGTPGVEFRGRVVLVVGDSVTQGWMELGEDLDQRAYLDALAKRGINGTLLWSYIGITDQVKDPRIGYEAPEVWPWKRVAGGFDLSSFNEAYFARLREFVALANGRGIVVVITVHDGWTKTRFAGHPFREGNGGWLTNKSHYTRLGRVDAEMPEKFDANWSKVEKHQFALERYCARLIEAVGNQPNVIFEMFNEGEWYPRREWEDFQRHFARFFKMRTKQPVMVNDDRHYGGAFRKEGAVDVISFHAPQWEKQPGAKVLFDYYAPQYKSEVKKPVLFSEPVPEYQGGADKYGAVIRLLWGTVLGGSGILFQNDTSWSFAPRSVMGKHIADRDRVLDFEGHLCRFVNSAEMDLGKMQPEGELASSGVCLAQRGEEYVAFFEKGREEGWVDLSAGAGSFSVRWYDPRTGMFREGKRVAGGGRVVVKSPFEEEGVVWARNIRSARE